MAYVFLLIMLVVQTLTQTRLLQSPELMSHPLNEHVNYVWNPTLSIFERTSLLKCKSRPPDFCLPFKRFTSCDIFLIDTSLILTMAVEKKAKIIGLSQLIYFLNHSDLVKRHGSVCLLVVIGDLVLLCKNIQGTLKS